MMSRWLLFVGTFILFTGQAFASPAGTALDRLRNDNRGPVELQSPVGQAQPELLTGLKVLMPGQSEQARALSFLERYRDLFLPGDQASQIKVHRVVSTSYGRITQMAQWFDGYRVFGASLAVGEDHLMRTRLVVNKLRPAAMASAHRILPPLALAEEAALRAYIGSTGSVRGQPWTETVWFPSGDQIGLVRLVTVPGSEPLGDYTYLVAGPTAKVLHVFARTPMVAQGYAYLSNPTEGSYQQVDLPYLKEGAGHLTGDYVTVYNCAGSSQNGCDQKAQLAEPDANGDYLIEPTGENDPSELDDKFGEVQAYYGINTIHDYFEDLGYTPTPILIGVNVPMPQPNAYYDQGGQSLGGPSIMMGQAMGIDLAVENDIIFHEYGHHVFGQIANASMFEMDEYGPVSHGLAMNEASADYFSCSALDDPELGEYFAEQLGPLYMPNGWLRNLDNDLTCPDGLFGEAHDDSVIWSGFLWNVRELLGQQQADRIYLDVLNAFPDNISFPSVTAIYMATAELTLDAGTMEQIQAFVDARGIADCTRFINLKEEGHTGFVWGLELLQGMASLDFLPGELHFMVQVPADATNLNIHWVNGTPGTDVILLVRDGQPVQHQLNLGTFNLDSEYDFTIEDKGGDYAIPSADPLFEPGHTYYFHPVNQGMKTGVYTIFGSVESDSSNPGTDGGTDGGTDNPDLECGEGFEAFFDGDRYQCVPACKDGFEPKLENNNWVCSAGGGGCAHATGTTPSLSALLLGLALAIFRRRRQS